MLNTHILQSFETFQSKFDESYNRLSSLCQYLLQNTSALNNHEDEASALYCSNMNSHLPSTLVNLENNEAVKNNQFKTNVGITIEKTQRLVDSKPTAINHQCNSKQQKESNEKCYSLLTMYVQGVKISSEGLTKLMQLKTLYIELFQILITQVE